MILLVPDIRTFYIQLNNENLTDVDVCSLNNDTHLLSFEGYQNCKVSPGLGYLLHSGDESIIKDIFDGLWELFNNKEVKYNIKWNSNYMIQVTKLANLIDHQAIFLNIIDNQNGISLKGIDLWRDLSCELPAGYGIIDIDDYFLNYNLQNINDEQHIFDLLNGIFSLIIKKYFKLQ